MARVTIQLVSVTRVSDVTDVLVGVFGALVGALCCAAYVASEPIAAEERWRRAYRFATVALWISAAAYLLDAANPYVFDWRGAGERLSWTSLVPLYAYYEKTTLQAVQDFVGGVANLMPVGVLFAFLRTGAERPGTRRSALAGSTLGAGAIALLGESLQVGLRRSPDVTDVLTGALGGFVGAWLWLAYAEAALAAKSATD